MTHASLPDAGYLPHHIIDAQLPSASEKDQLATLAQNAPVEVTGAFCAMVASLSFSPAVGSWASMMWCGR